MSNNRKEDKYIGNDHDFRYGKTIKEINRKIINYYNSITEKNKRQKITNTNSIYDNRILCLDEDGNSIGCIVKVS